MKNNVIHLPLRFTNVLIRGGEHYIEYGFPYSFQIVKISNDFYVAQSTTTRADPRFKNNKSAQSFNFDSMEKAKEYCTKMYEEYEETSIIN